MKNIFGALAISSLIISGCMKDDNTPPNPLEPTIFPTLTAFAFQIAEDGDTLSSTAIHASELSESTQLNTVRIILPELKDVVDRIEKGESSDSKSFVEKVELSEKSMLIIEYVDKKGDLWTSHVLQEELIMTSEKRQSVNSDNTKWTIKTTESFECDLHNSAGSSMKIKNIHFVAPVIVTHETVTSIQFTVY